jgi:hypothetical protein
MGTIARKILDGSARSTWLHPGLSASGFALFECLSGGPDSLAYFDGGSVVDVCNVPIWVESSDGDWDGRAVVAWVTGDGETHRRALPSRALSEPRRLHKLAKSGLPTMPGAESLLALYFRLAIGSGFFVPGGER